MDALKKDTVNRFMNNFNKYNVKYSYINYVTIIHFFEIFFIFRTITIEGVNCRVVFCFFFLFIVFKDKFVDFWKIL